MDLGAKNLPYATEYRGSRCLFLDLVSPAAVGLIFAWAIRKCDGWRNN
jgi:hypothetical protein